MLITIPNKKYGKHCMFSITGRYINESKFIFKRTENLLEDLNSKKKRKIKNLSNGYDLSDNAVSTNTLKNPQKRSKIAKNERIGLTVKIRKNSLTS